METLSIKEASNRTGISEDTIRYYEKIHLLPRANRNKSGHRVYDSKDIDLLIFITQLKSAGMSLETIKYYLDLSSEEMPTTAFERLTLLTEQKEKIEAKIAELQTTLKVIEHKQKHYQDLVWELKNT